MSENILLICNVGGTPEAVAASVVGSGPARVIFIVSPETRSDVEGKIIPILAEGGLTLPAGQFDYVEVPDAQDFTGCVEKMRQLGRDVAGWNERGEAYRVTVDFTGGTKCMSAALALVARQWQCRFSYVGGMQRNKDGKGIVVSGTEKILHFRNPWDALGYQMTEEAVLLFNRGDFQSAALTVKEGLPRISRKDVKDGLSVFMQLAEAYLRWDLFRHEDARTMLKGVLDRRAHLLLLFPADGANVVTVVERNCVFLERFENKPAGRHTLLDLVANARRCADRARYDDAVARLYRTIEAAAQLRLREGHGIESTSRVPRESIPEPLIRQWCIPLERKEIDIGLQQAFQLLEVLGDGLGKRFYELGRAEKGGSPLSARNQSILAHGFEAVGDKVFHELWEKTLTLVEIREDEFPLFPRVSSSVRGRGENEAK